MKKLLLCLAILSTPVFAQQPGLDQQLSVTRDAIQRLSQDLQHRDSSGGLRLSDYRRWEVNFKNEMERNFENYEAGITQKVFGPLKEIVSRMYLVANDPNLDQHQKDALIKSYKDQLETIKESITTEYHQLLDELYQSHNLLPKGVLIEKTDFYNRKGKKLKKKDKKYSYEINTLRFTYHDKKTGESTFTWDSKDDAIIACNKYGYGMQGFYPLTESLNGILNAPYICEVREREYGDARSYLLKNVNYSNVFERIIKGCQSKACIVVKTSDISFWYSSIFNLLDKPIEVEIPRGRLVIPARNLKIQGYINALKRTDYPASVEALPFDF